MITITGPAVAILLAIGYFGVNSIVNGINGLFRKDKDDDHQDSKK